MRRVRPLVALAPNVFPLGGVVTVRAVHGIRRGAVPTKCLLPRLMALPLKRDRHWCCLQARALGSDVLTAHAGRAAGDC